MSDEMVRAFSAGAWAVFSLSGGKDSSAAMFAGMAELDAIGHSRERHLALHSDLGRAEGDQTPGIVERIAAMADIELMIVRRARAHPNGKPKFAQPRSA